MGRFPFWWTDAQHGFTGSLLWTASSGDSSPKQRSVEGTPKKESERSKYLADAEHCLYILTPKRIIDSPSELPRAQAVSIKFHFPSCNLPPFSFFLFPFSFLPNSLPASGIEAAGRRPGDGCSLRSVITDRNTAFLGALIKSTGA